MASEASHVCWKEIGKVWKLDSFASEASHVCQNEKNPQNAEYKQTFDFTMGKFNLTERQTTFYGENWILREKLVKPL